MFDFKQKSEDFNKIVITIIQYLFIESNEKIFAFHNQLKFLNSEDGWFIYHPLKEFKRMNILQSTKWKITEINKNYELFPFYPSIFIVPSTINDDMLKKNITKKIENEKVYYISCLSWLGYPGNNKNTSQVALCRSTTNHQENSNYFFENILKSVDNFIIIDTGKKRKNLNINYQYEFLELYDIQTVS